MALLTEFDTNDVLRFSYGKRERAIAAMKRSLRINFKCRNNHPIAKSRAKSAIKVIRELRN